MLLYAECVCPESSLVRISCGLQLTTILITLLLAVPAMSVELFRYRGAGVRF
jgi:hypothetical protein